MKKKIKITSNRLQLQYLYSGTWLLELLSFVYVKVVPGEEK